MLHAYFSPFNLKDQILSHYEPPLRSRAGQSSRHPWEEALIRSRLRQPAGSQPWHFSIGATVPPPVENASWGTGQASRDELEWSRLASGSQGSRARDYPDLFCQGLVWPSITFGCQAGGQRTLPMTSHSHILCECCFDLPCGNEAWTTRAGSSKALYFA